MKGVREAGACSLISAGTHFSCCPSLLLLLPVPAVCMPQEQVAHGNCYASFHGFLACSRSTHDSHRHFYVFFNVFLAYLQSHETDFTGTCPAFELLAFPGGVQAFSSPLLTSQSTLRFHMVVSLQTQPIHWRCVSTFTTGFYWY